MPTILMLLSLFSHFAYSNTRTCSLSGKTVNPNNGAETAGKTGRMKCVDDSTKRLVAEYEYKDGKQMGYQMVVNFQGERTEQTVNERGNSIGTVKKYDSKNNLVSEENYGPGKQPGWTQQQGTSKSFYSSGKLKHLTWYEGGSRKFEAAYTEDGKMTSLACGDRSYLTEDKEVCGFGSHSIKVDIYNPKGTVVVKTISFSNGKPQDLTLLTDGKVTESQKISGSDLKKTEYFENGKPKIEAQYSNHVLNGDEKEFHQSGKIIRLTVWNKGKMEKEETYYLNGKQKTQVERKQIQGKWLIARKLFWDNGQLQEDGVYQEKTEESHWMDFELERWTYEVEVGSHHGFNETGSPAWTENYNDQGQLEGLRTVYDGTTGKPKMEETYQAGIVRARKQWNSNGQLEVDDEFFEDGSHSSRIKKGQGV